MAPRKNMFKLPDNVHVYIFVAIAMAGIIASTTYISQQLINRSSAGGEPATNEIKSAATDVQKISSDELPNRSSLNNQTAVHAENTDSIIAKITDSVLEKKKKKKKAPVF